MRSPHARPQRIPHPDETVRWSPSGPAALALTTSGALRVQRPRGPLVQAGTVSLIKDSQPLTVTAGKAEHPL